MRSAVKLAPGTYMVAGLAVPGYSAPAGQRVTVAAGQPSTVTLTYSAIPGAQTPGVQAPGVQTPGVQAPGVQAPGVQAPGVQAPGVQAPGVQAPGVQAPGVQAPGSADPGSAARGSADDQVERANRWIIGQCQHWRRFNWSEESTPRVGRRPDAGPSRTWNLHRCRGRGPRLFGVPQPESHRRRGQSLDRDAPLHGDPRGPGPPGTSTWRADDQLEWARDRVVGGRHHRRCVDGSEEGAPRGEHG